MPLTDETLLPLAAAPVTTIPDVIASLEAIDGALPDSDGLKWFNWLYLSVTRAVNASVTADAWQDPPWIYALDVVFARLYLGALRDWCTPGATASKCWQVLFEARNDTRLARVQFAIAGINAHITHDLPLAVVQTCAHFSDQPRHLSAQYNDYCQINTVLDPIVDDAKKELQVGLLGDNLPCIHLVEDLVAMFGLRATREASWTNAEMLWQARAIAGLEDRYLAGLDETSALAARGLLAPVGI